MGSLFQHLFVREYIPEAWELYVSTNLAAGKIFCMYVCMLRSRGRNFYPIATKFGTQVGLLKSKVSTKMGYVGPIETPRKAPPKNKHLNNFLATSPIF